MNLGKVIMTGVLATVLTSASFATISTSTEVDTVTTVVKADEDAKPQEIKVSELPKAVKKTLKSEVYKEWKAEKAFVMQKEDTKIYKVELSKGKENTTLMFNENGEAIKK